MNLQVLLQIGGLVHLLLCVALKDFIEQRLLVLHAQLTAIRPHYQHSSRIVCATWASQVAVITVRRAQLTHSSHLEACSNVRLVWPVRQQLVPV